MLIFQTKLMLLDSQGGGSATGGLTFRIRAVQASKDIQFLGYVPSIDTFDFHYTVIYHLDDL